jgi:hypothetical protein
MVGSIAPNLHEGSRSEYLAQYVFSSFGTAIPVPHPEDSGIDIYCTILERDGQRAWPRAYFSVQVKSAIDPWVFNSAEDIRWLIEHPLPIFLCIVLKSEARILVYNTTARFAAWAMPIHQKHLTLIPGTETKAMPVAGGWVEGESFQLRAPILNFTVQEILDDTFRKQVMEVLKLWIGYDVENLFRIKCGIHHFQVPYEYETNSTKVTGFTEQGGPLDNESFLLAQKRLTELLRVVAFHHHRKNELLSAAVYAMALRHLSTHFKVGEFTPHDSHLHGKINRAFETNRYAYDAVDSLLQTVKDTLSGHGITDAPVC